ncbi:predicted protein [Nematostella vectensis]|uniref:Sjoegren syndrome/scleroderma autoantigen 1 homolog n=2 Tax=Nematostella vectensis TaxID=45351 RepID=A7S4X2_NEMVE|nr:predicted protein [Nematostella vectensis]|eukprot:XP_001633291.1 predicted protein [Nematostella vectensis]
MDQDMYNRRRERTDKISGLMGSYMLRGYKMLGTCCDTCGTVLLKYREEPDYCVACKEVDVDNMPKPTEKGPPAMRQTPPLPSQETSRIGVSNQSSKPPNNSKDVLSGHHTHALPSSSSEAINTAIGSINDKIIWASEALKKSVSTEESLRLCELLKTCAETLRCLQEASD